MSTRPTEEGSGLRRQGRMAIGSDSTDGGGRERSLGKLFSIFKRQNSGGELRANGGRRRRIIGDNSPCHKETASRPCFLVLSSRSFVLRESGFPIFSTLAIPLLAGCITRL